MALWSETTSEIGANYFPGGSAVAVGWTRELRTPADTAGGVSEGRSAIVARGPVTPADGELNALTVRRDLIRGIQGGRDAARGIEARVPVEGSLFRFVLPASTASGGPGPLEFEVPAYFGLVQVWNGTEWFTIDDQLSDAQEGQFNGDPSNTCSVDVPPEGVVDGVVWARVGMRGDFGIFDGSNFELRSAE